MRCRLEQEGSFGGHRLLEEGGEGSGGSQKIQYIPVGKSSECELLGQLQHVCIVVSILLRIKIVQLPCIPPVPYQIA